MTDPVKEATALFIRGTYKRAMINAGLADYEIEEVETQFDRLITQAITEIGQVIELDLYRK